MLTEQQVEAPILARLVPIEEAQIQEANPIAQKVFDTKWVVNGFPKSGTHMLVQLIHPLAPYQEATEAGLFKQPWTGTFLDNSWTNRWAPISQTCFKLGRIGNGRMLKAHMGYIPELDRFIHLLGAMHLFIYRDLRDVAVSQAYHIINSKQERLIHPDPDAFRRLGGFDEILSAVIEGHGRFPGVVHRWEHYAGWISAQSPLLVKYEDLRGDPHKWARIVFTQAMQRSAAMWGRKVTFDRQALHVLTSVMAQNTKRTDKSPTFRKGAVGDWREEFTGQHVDLWRAVDKEKWLVRLGYAEGEWYGAASGRSDNSIGGSHNRGSEDEADVGEAMPQGVGGGKEERRGGSSGGVHQLSGAVEGDHDSAQRQVEG